MISNPEALKAEHLKLGITYSSLQPDGSFNDSEALLWDVALYLEGKQDELKAKGSIAFICIAIGKKDKLYFGRNTNPLNMYFNRKKGIMLSSEGKGQKTEPHTLYTFDYETKTLEKKPLDIAHYVYVAPAIPYKNYDPWEEDEKEQQRLLGFHYRSQEELDLEEVEDSILLDFVDSEVEKYNAKGYTGELDQNGVPVRLANVALSYTDNDQSKQVDIKTRVKTYLKTADGYFCTALSMATEDLNWLKEMEAKYYLENEEFDMDMEYEIEVQEAVIKVIIYDPEYVSIASQSTLVVPATIIKPSDVTFLTGSVQAIIQDRVEKAKQIRRGDENVTQGA